MKNHASPLYITPCAQSSFDRRGRARITIVLVAGVEGATVIDPGCADQKHLSDKNTAGGEASWGYPTNSDYAWAS